ncbi:hypothetical protein JOC70_001273 [Clostridium pascui]|uniref:hypothetical protein n=1 Tax=Clostridium pascui TaxID=46609 RepID=UPI001957ECA2|nr:hypothetical protein [Clostridium pascui]MBM7869803.1 hypothetical protein [Clostridium pascui]
MKTKVLLSVLVLSLALSVGCARENTNNQSPNTTQNQNQNQGSKPDGVTTASIVDNAAAFQKAIGTNGTWIIAIVKDVSTDKDLVLEGEYKNGKKDKDGKDIIQRKIALYTQDEKRNVTARFTLTAPKLTINSPNASIQHGTFKGDLYVSTKDFQLVDAKVDGNIYFTNDEAKAGFKMDDKSSVTGKQEVKK